MKDIEAFRRGIELTIEDLQKVERYGAGALAIKLILMAKAQMLNALGNKMGLCAPFSIHWDESLSKDIVATLDPRTGEGGLAFEIDDEDLVHNLIINIKQWVMVTPTRQHPTPCNARTGRILRKAGWFSQSTKGHLEAETLRKAAERGKLWSTRESKKGGHRFYDAEEVMVKWPDIAPLLKKRIALETGREPGQGRTKTD